MPKRRPAGAGGTPLWPHAAPGYQKQQGVLYHQLLETPDVEPKPAVRAEEPAALEGHSQSSGAS